jgi:hypothetical protein
MDRGKFMVVPLRFMGMMVDRRSAAAQITWSSGRPARLGLVGWSLEAEAASVQRGYE